jgi:predicted transcriptional regulator of viral defense system
MMIPEPTGRYGRTAGVDLAAALASAGLLIFRAEDAVRVAPPGVSQAQVPYLLKALTDAGWLIRLRRGLYAGTGQLPGGVDVPPFALATALVSPSAIALWSALAHHDLTDQVPVVVTAITPRKVVTPSMRRGVSSEQRHVWRAAGIDCRFVTLSEQRYRIGLERQWIGERFAVPITDRERTVLDTFAMPGRFGGINEGLGILERSLVTLEVEKLVDYTLQYGSQTLIKRMGWALEQVGVEMAALMPLMESASASYAVLDPGRPRRGRHDRRWKLVLNLNGRKGS